MKLSLKAKFSLSYAILALFLVALLSFMANLLLERHFRSYRVNQIDGYNREIAASIGHQYQNDSHIWNGAVIESIGINALEQGLIIKIRDLQGNIIWDATVHNNGLCNEMLVHMSQNMESRYPNFDGGYMKNEYPVFHNLKKVGMAEIGYYGPFYLNDNDLAFINTLNKMLISAGVLSLVFALIIGTIMARRLSTPISSVITAAGKISEGFYDERITEKTNTTEIAKLTSAVNHLAGSLKNQEDLRKRLSSDMAHELRTPLATLQSHMEAMIDGIWIPDEDRLKSCHEEILRINRMVGDLERLARFDGNNLVLNKTSFDISELIKHIMLIMEADFLNKGVSINFTGGRVEITADKDKISQVIVNLLTNALKFTPEGGKVEIRVKGSPDNIDIYISDTGKGMKEEDVPHIFERFYRADISRNRMTGGSGIGLAIVKAIVEAHDGRISVKSRLNRGTAFSISLPVVSRQMSN